MGTRVPRLTNTKKERSSTMKYLLLFVTILFAVGVLNDATAQTSDQTNQNICWAHSKYWGDLNKSIEEFEQKCTKGDVILLPTKLSMSDLRMVVAHVCDYSKQIVIEVKDEGVFGSTHASCVYIGYIR